MSKNKKNLVQENKNKIISLRFKPSELEKLDRKCKEVGLTRSAYISRKILSLPVQPARVPSINWDAYKVITLILYHLPRIGNNLNQIAKVLNTARSEGISLPKTIPTPEELNFAVETIEEIKPSLDRVRESLIGIKED